MRPGTHDPVDAIATVAATNWQRLLRIHHHRLSRRRPRGLPRPSRCSSCSPPPARGQRFADAAAILTALDMRFQSRIIDRHRALAGRSPISAALHHARPLDAITDTDPATAAGDPLAQVLERETLARLAERDRASSPPTSGSSCSPNSTASDRRSSARATAGASRNTARRSQRARARLRAAAALTAPRPAPRPRRAPRHPPAPTTPARHRSGPRRLQ